MKRFTFALSIAGVLLGAGHVRAQSVGRMLADDFTWAAQDIGRIFISPFRASGRDYLIAGGVLGASALLSPWDDNVDRWALANQDRGLLDALRPVRTGGDFYSLNQATPYVIGLYAVGLATKHRGIRDGIMGCAAAYTANTTIRHQIVYRLVGRNRPDTVRNRPEGEKGPPAQQGDQYEFSVPSDGWATHSFPGGHVATMTTCASFFAHRYDAPYLDPALIALVAAMGVGRIADRGHWLSDQTVGIAFGYAIGREVARRQLQRLSRERGRSSSITPTRQPILEASDDGVRMGLQFTF
jgi:membrane-associated phospholipid phosphatase